MQVKFMMIDNIKRDKIENLLDAYHLKALHSLGLHVNLAQYRKTWK